MIHQTYSRINTILNDTAEAKEKAGKLTSMFGVNDLTEIELPEPVSDIERDTKRQFELFMSSLAVVYLRETITKDKLTEQLHYANEVIKSYVFDPRLLTPLVILWAAGRMSRMGMEPSICFTRILDLVYRDDDFKDCGFDLKYTFRDKDVLRAFEEVRDSTLVDPIVKQDFLLAMKQILVYLKAKDRDFRKGLTLTQVEKLL